MLDLPNPLRSLSLATLAMLVAGAGAVSANEEPMVEVFTAAGLPVGTDNMGDRVQVFEVDGIERFEAALSHGLPPDRDAARRAALERIGKLNLKSSVDPACCCRSKSAGICR